jgi:hypothetical protein
VITVLWPCDVTASRTDRELLEMVTWLIFATSRLYPLRIVVTFMCGGQLILRGILLVLLTAFVGWGAGRTNK